jgi:pimeloyl-ACP methyl ester carboxylesterase
MISLEVTSKFHDQRDILPMPASERGAGAMRYVAVGEKNSSPIEVYYEDHGSRQPMLLVHGYPLNGHSWEKQVPVLLEAGH